MAREQKGKRKKMLKIFLIMIILVVIVIGGYLMYELNQLKKLEGMSAEDMLKAVTSDENTFVSMAIIENGEITYRVITQGGKEIDYLDYEYEIGSISKTFLGMLVAKAVDEGKIDVSASIAEYLPLPEGKYYPTIDRLLTHTSGYKNFYFESAMTGNFFKGRNSFYQVKKKEILDRVSSVKLKDRDYPFVYSNFGISVVGLVLESVYQEDYVTLVNSYMHEELKMNNSFAASGQGNLTGYWDWAPDDGYIPAGAIISDIKDMSAYLNYLMTSTESYVPIAFRTLKQIKTGSEMNEKLGIRIDEMCMTWCHDTENNLYWHNGATSNYNSYLAISEDHTKGIVILSNYPVNKRIPITVIGPKMMQDMK